MSCIRSLTAVSDLIADHLYGRLLQASPKHCPVVGCREQERLQEKLSRLQAAAEEAGKGRLQAEATGMAAAQELDELREQLQHQTTAHEAVTASHLKV